MRKTILTALIMLLTLSGCGGRSDLPDDDNDGIENSIDVFPNDASEVADTDNDGVGDNADVFPNDASEVADTDNDDVGDNADVFPNDASEVADTDNDGVGDNADVFPNDASEVADTDNDGVGDNADVFPNDASEVADTDNDGVGDNADVFPNDPSEVADTDNDGVGDSADVFPNDPSEVADTDNDGIGDNRDNSINANAGVDSSSILNYSLQLNANDTENPEGSPLSFIWDVIEQPENSLPILTESESATPEFSANMLGVYKIKLVVADGLLNDSEDTITVTVKEPYSIVYGLYTPSLTATLCSINGDLFNTGWRLDNCVAYASAGAKLLVGIRNNHPEEDLTINAVGLSLSIFLDEYSISADSMIVAPNQSSVFNLTTKTSGVLTSASFVIKDVGRVTGVLLDKTLSTLGISDSYY